MGIENHEVLGTIYTGTLGVRVREAELDAIRRQREYLARKDLTFPIMNMKEVQGWLKQAKEDAIAKWRADGEPE